MVRIEVTKNMREYIDMCHKAYVEQVIFPKLEEKININKGASRRFLKSLFGGTKLRRKETLVYFCLSPDLDVLLEKFDETFVNVYGFNFNNSLNYQGNRDKYKPIIESVRSDLDEILYYEEFNTGKVLKNGTKWNRHQFISSLGIKVCPYCNRQYITSYENDVCDDITTADADHYYHKAANPILQMNIYNLIPSCNVCNSKTKGKRKGMHLYPYKDSSDSLVFMIPIEMTDKVSKILIDTKMNPKANTSVEIFKLDKIYQAHTDVASEIKERIQKYYQFKEEVYKAEYGLKVNFNIFDTWFNYMGKNISDEPLTKLKQDVHRQVMDELIK